MEPFRITCVTCTAKLIVRNEAAIGQILACPRCGSMVEVVAPAACGLAASGVEAEAAPAKPQAAIDAPSFDDAEALASAADAAPELSASPNWEAAAGVARYKLAAWCISGAAAVIGAAGMLVYITSGDEPAPDAVAETVAKAPAAQTQPADPPQVSSSAPVKTPPPIDAPPSAAPVEGVEELDPPEQLIQAAPAKPQAKDALPPTQTATETPQEVQRKPTLRIDPLDLDPEGLDLALLANAVDDHPSAVRRERPDGTHSDQARPVEARMLDLATAPVVERDPHGVGRVAAADVDKLLGQRFPRIQIEAMPLCEFLDFMTGLAGVPVSVTAEQLRLAGVSANRSVTIDAEDVSVNEALTNGLKKLRLRATVDGSQAVIQRAGDNPLRTIEYPLDDLVDDETSVEQISHWIEQLVEPEAWSRPGSLELGDGAIKATQHEYVQYQVLLLLERLRLARDLPTRSSYPADLLSARSSFAAMHQRLSAPTTFTFSQYTPVADVIRFWEQEIGLAVLVDWPALAEVDLWPRSRVSCSAADEPWHSTLDAVLTPLDLAWTAADEQTLVITTSSAAATRPQLEFYRIEDESVDVDQLIAQLTLLAREDSDRRVAHVFDRPSRTLIVLAPAAVHRQFAEWLTVRPAAD